MELIKKIVTFFVLVFAQIAFAGTSLNLKLSPEAIKNILHPENVSVESRTNKKFTFIIKIEHRSLLAEDWARKLCSDTANSLMQIYGSSTQSHCFLKDSDRANTDYLIEDAKYKLKPDFQLDLKRELDGTIRVTLTNLNQTDKNYTNKVGWKITYTNNFLNDLKDKLIDSSFTINNLETLRDALVEIIYNECNIQYNQAVHGTRENFYKSLLKTNNWTPKTRRFLTAGSELLATLSFGWYGYNYLTTNQQDFDYDRESKIKVFVNKITGVSMLRYDDNAWSVNRNHVYAGVVYYLECRSTGFSALESYLCAIAGSTAWETVVEWREVYSINDQIFTIQGGAIMGEAIHQMGNYIDHKAPKWFKNTIGWAWRGPKKLEEVLNGKVFNGEDSDIASDSLITSGKFEFEMGTLKIADGKTTKVIGLSNQVNLIPLSDQPGHEVKFIKDLVETQFSFDAPTESIANQYDIFAKVVLAAYYNKKLSTDSSQNLQGYSFYVGPSAALDIKNNQDLKNDFMGIVHVIGTTAKLINYYKGFKITSTLDFWGDSVMMKSFMIEKYAEKNGRADLVTNLADSSYYHGFGMTTKGQVIVPRFLEC